ncbi:MAG TPA: hypothetical protein VHR97_11490 [Candidatus Baltobacteraceae bacterium]|jgi:hypothetical protein|nr:hypothetical protein [Candidatus Baltobacteraceae bacterium]
MGGGRIETKLLWAVAAQITPMSDLRAVGARVDDHGSLMAAGASDFVGDNQVVGFGIDAEAVHISLLLPNRHLRALRGSNRKLNDPACCLARAHIH